MDVYSDYPLPIISANFGKVDVHISKYEMVDDIAKEPVKGAYI